MSGFVCWEGGASEVRALSTRNRADSQDRLLFGLVTTNMKFLTNLKVV